MTESEASTILKTEIVHHPECSVFAEALDLAIQALEKQISKKPIRHAAWYDIHGRDKTDDEIQEQWCSENIKH